jgi:EAL domain-containing protein (putative c-di-GMP-specific phosphodiesterase class I)
MISPAKFIPLAEETGLIIEIGEWVLEEVCWWVKSCCEQSLGPLHVAVNLSPIQFRRPDIVEKVAGILAKTGVDPKCIELELTESVAILDAKTCISRMNDLKHLGVSIAMDDFGTGYSSLSYLKELPLDILKIDQSFVHQLESNDSSQAIAKAILALADGLGMEVVAEGVETEDQFEFLKQHNCRIFQGYLFSRPILAEDFLQLLAADHPKTSS